MKIELLNPDDCHIWDKYVQNHDSGTIFHLMAWKNVIEKSFGHKSYYLVAYLPLSWKITSLHTENNTKHIRKLLKNNLMIVGVLPIFRIKSILFGNYLVSVPFAEIGGPLTDNNEVEKALLVHAASLATEMKCEYLEIRNREQINEFYTKDLYYNFQRKIDQDVDKNFMMIPRKARRMIRKGEKSGLASNFNNKNIDRFYRLMARSYHNLGTPIYPKKYFNQLINEFGENAQILIIKNKKGVPVSGVLTFYYKDRVIPYYAGSLPKYRSLAPNDYMYWILMKYGCENGYRIFDFGRSKINTGSFHFKRHWGFEPVKLAYQYALFDTAQIPNLSPSNPKYKWKIKIWKKMPYIATKIAGPLISKYLA